MVATSKTSTTIPKHVMIGERGGQWYLKLNDGNEMPMVGCGTWQETDEVVRKSVGTAVRSGYRLIDTARDYENEGAIGDELEALFKEGVVKRQDLFITTKLHPSNMAEDEVVPSLMSQLAKLKLDYVDLFLIHWPMSFINDGKRLHPVDPRTDRYQYDYKNRHYTLTWRGMEAAFRMGLTRSIGVSNFNKRQVEDILLRASIRPAVLQIESHPLLGNSELIQWCQDRNIAVTAYSPFGNPGSQLAPKDSKKKWPNLVADPSLQAIGSKYGNKTPANVMLRWQLQRGVSVIPKSAHEDRVKSNFNVYDFELSRSDMEAINSMDKGLRTCPFTFSGNSSSRDYPFDEYRDTNPWEEKSEEPQTAR